jgi:hypothetical protein
MITYFTLVEKNMRMRRFLKNSFDFYDELTLAIERVQDERGMVITKLLDKEAAGTLTDEKSVKDAQEINIKNYGIVMGSVNSTLGKLADCDQLIPLYEAEFENKKGDELVIKCIRRLQSKECTDAPLYITSVKALHVLNPEKKNCLRSR